MKLGRKILLMLLAIFATTVVAAGIYLTTTYNYATGELSKTFRTSKAISGNSKAIQQTKPITILLMGVDTGSKERKETWEGNSDTMILVTVNPKTKKTTMTSLERDLLTDIEGSGEAKLNSAYAEGGADLAISTIQKVLDIDIDYYALINMQGMIDLVDAVGGIEVTNHFDFPISIAENEPEFQAKVEPGTHKINGEQALVYSRMRYDDPDGDYGRQKRQQQILKSVINKFKASGSIGAANKILDAVGDGVKTNIPIDDIATLYGNYHGAMNNVKTYHFQGQNATIEGVSFQIASPKEINRVSKLVRAQLGLKAKNVVNHETKMYKSQPHYNGYNETDFILPGGASYNDPGSGNGSDEVIGSSSHHSSSATEESASTTEENYGTTNAYSESRAVLTTGTASSQVRRYSTPQYHSYNNGYPSTYTHPTYGNHYGYTHRYY